MLKDELKAVSSTKKDLSQFGLIVGLAFTIIGTLALLTQRPIAGYFIFGGLALATVGLMRPGLLLPLQRPWMKVSLILGHVMTFLILTLTFYLFIMPIGLILKITAKRQNPAWNIRSSDPSTDSFFKQF